MITSISNFKIIKGIKVYIFKYKPKLDLSFSREIGISDSKETDPEEYIDEEFEATLEPLQKLFQRVTLADLISQIQEPLVFRTVGIANFAKVINFGKDRTDDKKDIYGVGSEGFYGTTYLKRALTYGDLFPKLLLMYEQSKVQKRQSFPNEDIYDFVTSPKSALSACVILKGIF